MKNKSRYVVDSSFNKKTSKALNQFWAGFIIYTTCYTLIISGVVSSKLVYLQLLGLVILIIPTIHLIRFRIESKYLKTIYILYCGWLIYIIFRGFSFNSKYLFNTFIDAYDGLFAYFVPLILLFPNNLIYLKKVINVILFLSIFYVVCDIIFIRTLLTSDSENGQRTVEYFTKILGIPCGFVLLNIIYHSDKRKGWALLGKLWVLSVIILAFLLATIRARRGLTFMSGSLLLFTYLLYNYATKINLVFKFLPLLIVFFLFIYVTSLKGHKRSGPFSFFRERLNEDTRTSVEQYFFLDMDSKDWIIGKGIDGMYYCPTGATEDGYRQVIETGYLQIILKGGIISLGLLFLITFPAIFKGLFYSKNILSKAAAIWILYWMLALFPATVSTFTLSYLLVWVSIGICYSRVVRNMSDEAVKENFQYKIF